WASLAIDELDRKGAGEDRARVVGMSQAYGVLSRETSLLVLESDAMFQAFGVERAREVPTWTGNDALDEVAADGTIDYDEGDTTATTATPASQPRAGAGRADGKAAAPAKAKKADAPPSEHKGHGDHASARDRAPMDD